MLELMRELPWLGWVLPVALVSTKGLVGLAHLWDWNNVRGTTPEQRKLFQYIAERLEDTEKWASGDEAPFMYLREQGLPVSGGVKMYGRPWDTDNKPPEVATYLGCMDVLNYSVHGNYVNHFLTWRQLEQLDALKDRMDRKRAEDFARKKEARTFADELKRIDELLAKIEKCA